MPKLTLTLSGPMAAYGTGPRLQHRLTGTEPTESAVLGLLGAALGLARGETSPILQGLVVKVQQASHQDTVEDFHTLREAVTYDGKPGRNSVTTRHYLAGFQAKVAIHGERDKLEAIARALHRPAHQLYLGRRNCVPDGPIWALTKE